MIHRVNREWTFTLGYLQALKQSIRAMIATVWIIYTYVNDMQKRLVGPQLRFQLDPGAMSSDDFDGRWQRHELLVCHFCLLWALISNIQIYLETQCVQHMNASKLSLRSCIENWIDFMLCKDISSRLWTFKIKAWMLTVESFCLQFHAWYFSHYACQLLPIPSIFITRKRPTAVFIR